MIAPLRHFLPHFLLVAAISAPATAATDPLTDYIEQALQSNHALRSQDYAVEASARALDEARAQYWPKLGLNARYTVAEGGRQLNFPVGDLLNPVYQTLNAMTANSQNPTNFPTIDNQQISLLRDREQDTRLTVSTPLYVPQLAPQLALRSALKDAATAGREVVARGLVRDTKNAYYGLSQAQARIGILESSQRTLAENERITEALLRAGKSTRDQVLRAQAERIAIEQSLLQARNGVAQARRYLNLLRNAPQNAEIALVGDVTSAPLSTPVVLPEARPELHQLDGNLAAARASEQLAKATFRPSVVFAADGGFQGEDYRWRGDSGVATASVVMNWTLYDFGIRRAQTAKAQAERQQLEATRQNVYRQLELSIATARDNLQTATQSLITAQARLAAADEAFRIASRKRDAGALSQIEFFDSERALTEARLGVTLATLSLNTSQAEWEYATASFPLPATGAIAGAPALPTEAVP